VVFDGVTDADQARDLTPLEGEHRRELVPTLNAFARAAGEIPNSEPWVLGWTTEQPAGDNVATDDRTT
jgi:hypothetical protein